MDEDSTNGELLDEKSDPAAVVEDEEQLMLLRWILKEAAQQHVVVDADSPEFIAWAIAMINSRNNFKEKERRGLSS